MPRNVRNVWVSTKIDGRARKLEGGPSRKDGGMSTTIYVRDNGSVLPALEVWTTASHDGTIRLHVHPLPCDGRWKIGFGNGKGFIPWNVDDSLTLETKR